jgi:hypothetical protein
MYTHHWNGGDFGPMNYGGGHEWWFANFPVLGAVLLPLLVLVIIWCIAIKGIALWHAGRRNEPWWFIVILLVNTLGIVELLYLFGVAKLKPRELFGRHEHR